MPWPFLQPRRSPNSERCAPVCDRRSNWNSCGWPGAARCRHPDIAAGVDADAGRPAAAHRQVEGIGVGVRSMIWSHSTRFNCSRVGPSRLSHTGEWRAGRHAGRRAGQRGPAAQRRRQTGLVLRQARARSIKTGPAVADSVNVARTACQHAGGDEFPAAAPCRHAPPAPGRRYRDRCRRASIPDRTPLPPAGWPRPECRQRRIRNVIISAPFFVQPCPVAGVWRNRADLDHHLAGKRAARKGHNR